MAENKQIGKSDGVAQLSSFDPLKAGQKHSQEYYDAIKNKFAEERDLRLAYRPEGTGQFNSNFEGDLAHYGEDSYNRDVKSREAMTDTVEVLFIGGGFSALLTAPQRRSANRSMRARSTAPQRPPRDSRRSGSPRTVSPPPVPWMSSPGRRRASLSDGTSPG